MTYKLRNWVKYSFVVLIMVLVSFTLVGTLSLFSALSSPELSTIPSESVLHEIEDTPINVIESTPALEVPIQEETPLETEEVPKYVSDKVHISFSSNKKASKTKESKKTITSVITVIDEALVPSNARDNAFALAAASFVREKMC
jgi:hypothetical protein